jgi:predicted amidohydrolase YtcJ
MLIARAELFDGGVRDVRIEREQVTEVAERLRPRSDEDVIDARGGALIPGLHDHHVHLLSLAAADLSIHVGPEHVDGATLAARLRSVPGTGWIRAVGYHETVAGPLDRHALDRLVPERPVRIQHRTGSLWMLNSAGVDATGLGSLSSDGIERAADGTPTGRIWRLDRQLREVIPPLPLDLESVGEAAARRGVTGFTDATPYDTAGPLAAAADRLRQPVWSMGSEVDASLRPGPLKLVLDEAWLPGVDELAAKIARAHDSGRAAAVHCVTRAELLLALCAFEEAGSSRRDRIEHAAIVPTEAIDTILRLGLTVVTQPSFVLERGDSYLDEVDEDDLGLLYRLRSLRDAGVPVAAGTDAPFGSADPWSAISAASRRRTRRGRPLGTSEALDPRSALALFLGAPEDPARPRSVAPGTRDLVLLDGPLDRALAEPDAGHVKATWIDGAIAWSDQGSVAGASRNETRNGGASKS